MALLPITLYGETPLRETARPIEAITERHQALARDMAETMYQARGIGLAANQVGLLERIIIVDVNWNEDERKPNLRPVAMINPEVLEESVEDEESSEGCLSLPGINGDVWRPLRIRYRYLTIHGKRVETEAEGLEARCILHEIDHLNGVLFIDRMSAAERAKLAGKLAQLRQLAQK
jgi:peptide deformylase